MDETEINTVANTPDDTTGHEENAALEHDDSNGTDSGPDVMDHKTGVTSEYTKNTDILGHIGSEVTRVAHRAAHAEQGDPGSAEIHGVITPGISNVAKTIDPSAPERQSYSEDDIKKIERYESMIGGTHDIVFFLDQEGNIVDVNPAVTEIAGHGVKELVGTSFAKFVLAEDLPGVIKKFTLALKGEHEVNDFRVVTKNGEIKWMRASSNILPNRGGSGGLTVQMMDLTDHMNDLAEIKELHKELAKKNEELSEQNEYDSLTGLKSRRALDRELDRLKTSRSDYPFSLIFIDIDDFKSINDTYGHKKGDEVLKLIAKILRTASRREGDFIARSGGDEFVIPLPLTAYDAAQKLIDRINRVLNGYNMWGQNVSIHLSMGLATAKNRDEFGEIVERADKSMYEDKITKKVSGTEYPPQLETQLD